MRNYILALVLLLASLVGGVYAAYTPKCADGLLITWSSGAETCGSINAATPQLDNLSSVAVNASLAPGTAGTLDLGSATKPWEFLFFSGTSGTPGTNNFKLTGASTSGTRTITFPDATTTLPAISGTPTTNNCVKWVNATTIGDQGTACGGSVTDTFTIAISYGDLSSHTYTPAASTTYYGDTVENDTSGNKNAYTFGIPIPVASHLSKVYWRFNANGLLASNENVTHQIRLNNTTDTTGCTAAWNSATGTSCNESPNLSLAAGDYLTVKIVTPAWVTSPTNMWIHATLYFTAP